MSIAKALAQSFHMGPVATDRPVESRTACVLTRQAAMEKAAQSLKDVNDLLGCVTKELAEGDLELSDLIVPAR